MKIFRIIDFGIQKEGKVIGTMGKRGSLHLPGSALKNTHARQRTNSELTFKAFSEISFRQGPTLTKSKCPTENATVEIIG